jgi:hypothetical protein
LLKPLCFPPNARRVNAGFFLSLRTLHVGDHLCQGPRIVSHAFTDSHARNLSEFGFAPGVRATSVFRQLRRK